MFDALRQALKFCTQRALIADRNQAARTRNLNRNQIQCGQLRRVRLGGGNRDLWPRPSVQYAIRFTRNGRRYDIHDRDRKRTRLLRQAHSSQCICRLARLANYDAQILLTDNRVLVTEFRRNLCRAANTAHCFNHALTHHTCVQRRTTRNDVNIFNIPQTLIRQTVFLKHNRIVLNTRLYRIAHCLGLLHDLLEHKVLITALFSRGQIPVDRLHLLFDHVAELVHYNHAVRTDDRNLVVVKDNVFLGTADDCRDVGSNHVLAFTNADDQRVITACRNDLFGIIHRDHAQCVRTTDTLHGFQYSLGQVFLLAGVQIVNQMRNRLGIGLRLESIAVRLQTYTQFLIVLNNAVMHDRNLAHTVTSTQMRVGVAVGWLAMCRPARMADAAGAGQLALFADLLLKVGNAAACFDHAQAILGKCCDTCRVITAVFQTVQTLNQNRQRIFTPRKTDNTTHKSIIPP